MNFQAWKSPGEKEHMKISWKNPGNFCEIHYSHLMANHAFSTIYIHVNHSFITNYCENDVGILFSEWPFHMIIVWELIKKQFSV